MYKRRHYFIDKSLQLRYMAMVAILMVILSISTAWLTYSTTWMELIRRFEDKAVLLDRVFIDLNAMLLVRLSLLTFAGICMSAVVVLFAVHRIAGPLFRVKRVMGTIGEGIVPGKVKFRPKDEFKDLAGAINDAISKIGDFREKSSEAAANAEACLRRAKEYLGKASPETDNALKEIESVIASIEGFEVFRSEETVSKK